MKLKEIKDKVELIMSDINFTELLETQNTIDVPPLNQYQIKNFKQNPNLSYDDYKFDLILNFESNEQMYDLFTSAFQYQIKSIFEVPEISYDDINNKIIMKLQVIW